MIEREVCWDDAPAKEAMFEDRVPCGCFFWELILSLEALVLSSTGKDQQPNKIVYSKLLSMEAQ